LFIFYIVFYFFVNFRSAAIQWNATPPHLMNATTPPLITKIAGKSIRVGLGQD